jgi:GTP-binding protein HflX
LRETLRVSKERVILVAAYKKDGGSYNDHLEELTALAESAGAVVVDRFIQKIRDVNPATYIGKGKAGQLAGRVKHFNAHSIIFDNDLWPNQIRELEKIVGVKVIDRSELILDIFATRARTKQAKLQVELAQLQYTYPRLTRMWSHLDNVAGAGGGTAAGAVGGIGTRGTGEKQLEIDRRLVNKRITDLKRELEVIDKRKLREIDGRERVYKVCLVGYTNAGKSTLMNRLTDADVFVEDRLFATLDTRTKRWGLDGVDVLLSDTVGFVRNLPHHLVASFKATLEEAVNADLLVHVVDVSSGEVFEQIKSVERVLEEIGCGDKQKLVLLNKADTAASVSSVESLETIYPDAICISAKTGMNIDKVHEAVLGHYKQGEVTVKVQSHQANGKVQSFLRASGRVISERYVDSYVDIEAKLGRKQLPMLRKLRPGRLEIVEL